MISWRILDLFKPLFYRMTDYDIKNYLEKIYNVPVLTVRTHLEKGKIKQSLLSLIFD